MKTKKKYFFIFFVLISLVGFAQKADSTLKSNSYVKGRWNSKISYQKAQNVYNYFRLEANYGLFKMLETGLYFGMSKQFIVEQSLEFSSGYSTKKILVPNYGINLNFHLLPLFVKKQDFRFDLYLYNRMGGIYYSAYKKHIFEYEFGGGLVFYPLKHIGAHIEYSPITNLSPNVTNLRFGLSFKF